MSVHPAPKRACDACHRRKVRCNSRQPCGNCSQAGLSCTYNAIPQKKGPKGSRAKVISELRETQTQTPMDMPMPSKEQPGRSSTGSRPSSPVVALTPGLLSAELIDACSTFFFAQMYPTMPILERTQLRALITNIDHSVEAYTLVTALCAFMLIQPGIAHHQANPASVIHTGIANGAAFGNGAVPITNLKLGATLMEEAVRVRKDHDHIECPSVLAAITSFFLFGSSFGLNKHNAAWFHLREATAMAQILGLQDENTYLFGNAVDASRNRRLFWLLFVTERAYALQKHRPLTLHATIALPTVDSDSALPLHGFLHLVNLYRPFDDTFIGLWNKSRTDCSTFWLAQLQQQLTEALPPYLNTTESQEADLRVSQQWLRTMVWQLSITNGYLSSTSPNSSMTFHFPIEIARDLANVTAQFSKRSMDIHGVGLIEKIFDVACTLIDVMSCVPSPPIPTSPLNNSSHTINRPVVPNPQEYLFALIHLIATLRSGESKFLPLILAKVRDTLPALADSLPTSFLARAAPGTGSLVNGSGFGPMGGINGHGNGHGFGNGMSIKTESQSTPSSGDASMTGSPFP